MVFGGASIPDAMRNRETTIDIPGWIGDRWPGFPNVQVRTDTSIGDSALFGARYSRYVKGRLAAEADLAVAPTHDLQTGGALCLDARCFGGAEGGSVRGPWGQGPGRGDFDFDQPSILIAPSQVESRRRSRPAGVDRLGGARVGVPAGMCRRLAPDAAPSPPSWGATRTWTGQEPRGRRGGRPGIQRSPALRGPRPS